MNSKELANVGAERVAPAPLPLTKKDAEQLTEKKSRELINNQDFVDIVRQVANAEWDGKPLVEDMVYHLKNLAGLEIAIIKDNRRTHRRTMRMLKACMENGMTTPAILVSAKLIYDWGLSLIDPTSGNEIKEDELDKYYGLMEGHARLDAWVLSILHASMTGGEPFDFHFVYKEYASPEDFGKAYTSSNLDMTRTTNKDRMGIAGARSKNPLVINFNRLTKVDKVIPKAAYYWTYGRELNPKEVSLLMYDDVNTPYFDMELCKALSKCYEAFKKRFSADGAEKVYRGVPAAQWCAYLLSNDAENKMDMANDICDRIGAIDDRLYTPIVTAKTSKKDHVTRDQKIKLSLDMMMNAQ